MVNVIKVDRLCMGSVRGYYTGMEHEPIGHKVKFTYTGSFVVLYSKYGCTFYNSTSSEICIDRVELW